MVVAFILVFALAPIQSVTAEVSSLKEPYDIYETFATNYPDRTPGSTGEANAATFIAEQLASIKNGGGAAYVGSNGGNTTESYIKTFKTTVSDSSVSGGSRDIVSRNVVAYKRSGVNNAKLLVISCEYGNAFSLTDDYGLTYRSEGAYEFSTSVAALISVAYQLRNTSLDFDVAFAFFGAGCYESRGVQDFLQNNEQTLLGNIDLYAVGGGKDLNIYYDEISTAHGKFFDERIARFGYDIKSAPFDKKYYSLDSDAFAVRHIGLSSSNYFFLKQGVPAVELFGYDWGTFSGDSILGTSSDTLSYMNANYDKADIQNRLELVRDFVAGSVTANSDLANAFEAYKGGYGGLTKRSTYWIFTGVALGLVVLLIAAGGVYYSRKTMTSNVPTFTASAEIVEKEEKDDVYDFFDNDETVGETKEKQDIDTQDDNNSRDDDDDIFGEL